MRTLIGTRRVLPTGTNLLFLDRAQHFGLQIDRKFSDFVEKNGSSFGHGHEPVFGLVGAGERALHVAEQFTLDQGGHERSAIDRDERLVAEGTGIVNGARHHLFAGAALAQNQHRVHAVGGLGDDAIELFHFRGAADDAAESLFGLHLLAQQTVLRLQLQVAGHALQQQLQFVETEGLGHVVIGAILHGLHGRLHGAIAGHHDDDGLGPPVLDAPQRVESACARQAQIEQHGIKGLGVEQAVSVLGGIGYIGGVSERLRDFAASLADGSFIVHNQKVKKIGGFDLRCGGHRT